MYALAVCCIVIMPKTCTVELKLKFTRKCIDDGRCRWSRVVGPHILSSVYESGTELNFS